MLSQWFSNCGTRTFAGPRRTDRGSASKPRNFKMLC